MTGVWMLPAAFALLPAAWFLIARPLARLWGGCWWGKEHGKKARSLRAREKAAHVWPFGTGWALLTRAGAGAGVLWLLWPVGALQKAGGWAAFGWLLGVWMVLGAVRDYAVLHAAARSEHTAPAGIAPLLGGEFVWRLFLLLGWFFCVLLLAALGGLPAASRLMGTAAGDYPTGPAGWDAAGSAVTAGLLLTAGAAALGVVLRYAALRRTARIALSLGILMACLAAGLVCPISLGPGILCISLLFGAFCAAAAPGWLLARPRGMLCGWLLLFCLAAGIFTAGLQAADVSPAALTSPPVLAGPGGWKILPALLFAAGGGTAAGLQMLASGCMAARLLRPAPEDAQNTARRERAVCAVGFGGALLPGLLAAAVLAVFCGVLALPGADSAAAESGSALAADAVSGYAGVLAGCLAPLGPASEGVGVLVRMMAALAGLSALDAAAVAGRSALQCIFGSTSLPLHKLAPWRKLLRSGTAASLLTVLPALLLSELGPDLLLPLLDGLGWLVSGLALLAAILSHRRAGRRSGMLWPLAAALLAAGWLSLARYAVRAGTPAGAGSAAVFALAAIVIAACGLRRAAQGAANAKAAKEGKKVHRAPGGPGR